MDTKTEKVHSFILNEHELKIVLHILQLRSSQNKYLPASEQELRHDIEMTLRRVKYEQ